MATTISAPFSQITSAQRRTLLAAALGWMLDAFDAMLYALVLAHVMRDLGMSKGTAGLLDSLTLLASGIGGVAFGFIADRMGRKRALMLSILTYSVCSFASGLSTSVLMLAVFRFILGLGMGGEWNTGATLVAETWPTELRAKAISIVQSSWAIGYALAALVTGIVLHYADWRMVFFVGVLPALVVLWIRRGVPESAMWQESHGPGRRPDTVPTDFAASRSRKPDSSRIFRPPYCEAYFRTVAHEFLRHVCLVGTIHLDSAIPLSAGRAGRTRLRSDGNDYPAGVLNVVGMFPGYASFGWVADHLGRRKSFILYTFMAAFLVPLYAAARAPWVLMVVGNVAGIFRYRFLLRLRNYRQRNLPHRGSGPGAGFYLQWRAYHEFDCAICNRTRRPDQRLELGILSVRCRVSAGLRDGDAVA